MAEANELDANNIIQDIEHTLEFENNTYHEKARFAARIGEERGKRRAAKDIMNKTLPIVNWVTENQSTIKSLETLLGGVRKAERNTENRVYTPRTNEVAKTKTRKVN